LDERLDGFVIGDDVSRKGMVRYRRAARRPGEPWGRAPFLMDRVESPGGCFGSSRGWGAYRKAKVAGKRETPNSGLGGEGRLKPPGLSDPN